MRYTTTAPLCLALAAVIASPLPAPAAPAITCHCFKDRSYDPARPAIADPYFLATAQNSFFAAAFGVDKKSIVVKKQTGISGDDLWAAYWLGLRSGRNPEALLQERKSKGSWRLVAAPLAIPDASLGTKVSAALKADDSDERLATAIVDELLLRLRLYSEPEISKLRKAGASNQELLLLRLIAARYRQPANQIYSETKKGTSWGALLQRAKIEPKEIQSEISALVVGK